MDIRTQMSALGHAEVIVVLDAPAARGKQAARAAKAAPRMGLRAGERDALQTAAGKLEKCFKQFDTAQDAELIDMLAAKRPAKRKPAAGAGVHYYPNLGIMLGTVDSKGLAALRKSQAVKQVVAAPELSLIRPVARSAALAAPPVKATWGIKRLGVDALWDQGFRGEGIVVGHCDTGIDASHPALQGAVKAYAEFDMMGEQVPNAPPRDSGDHGTHTAGTIAGRPVKNVAFGVAPGAELLSAQVIEGGHVKARILGGMNWAVGEGARILSMSLGLRGYDAAFLAVVRVIRQLGVLPVFAVGNEGPGTSRSPGNYSEALSVGASDDADRVATFSSSRRFARKKDPLVPDLVAPGVDVVSCIPGGQFMLMSGTSMATPHIAGLAAVLMQARPQRSAAQIEAAIFNSCRLPATMSVSRASRGVPLAQAALQLL